jgi:hypothetical protein
LTLPVRRRLAWLALLVASASCTSALNKPPPIADLAGPNVSPAGQEDIAATIARAQAELARAPDIAAVERARQLYLQASVADDPPVEAFLGASRANTWLVEHDPDADRRAKLATQGVQIGQLCRQQFPDEPECRYRIALAVGQQARERPSTAVDGLDVMVDLLLELTREAPALDSAGPDRVLALVLLRAPGWPAGPGDPESGLEHAVAAAAAFPDYPPNQLALGEALLANGRPEEGRRALEQGITLAEPLAAHGDAEAAEWIAEARQALDGSH